MTKSASYFKANELHRVGEVIGRLSKAVDGMTGDQGIITLKVGAIRVLDCNGHALGSIVRQLGEFVFKAAV